MARAVEDRLDRIERILEDAGRKIDGMGDALGRFAEGLIAPSLPRALERFGIEVEVYGCREARQRDGETMEADVVAVGRKGAVDIVVAVEVKAFRKAADVNRWSKRLDRFREFFPEYRAHDLIAGIAGMQLGKGVAEHAERQGLIVLGPGDGLAKVLNRASFRPNVWPAPRRGRRSP